MKKTREFHDNESEIISGESELLCRCGTIYNVQAILMSLSPHRGCGAYSRAALINLLSPRCGAYASKYGSLMYSRHCDGAYMTTPSCCWGNPALLCSIQTTSQRSKIRSIVPVFVGLTNSFKRKRLTNSGHNSIFHKTSAF